MNNISKGYFEFNVSLCVKYKKILPDINLRSLKNCNLKYIYRKGNQIKPQLRIFLNMRNVKVLIIIT